MSFLNYSWKTGYNFDPKVVKTRSSHECYGCAEIFDSGSTLTRFTVKREGVFNTTYWCTTCICVANERLDSDRELEIGELRELYPEEYE